MPGPTLIFKAKLLFTQTDTSKQFIALKMAYFVVSPIGGSLDILQKKFYNIGWDGVDKD